MSAVAAYAVGHPGRRTSPSTCRSSAPGRTRISSRSGTAQGRTLSRSDSSAGRDLPKLASLVGHPTYHDLTLPDGHRGRAISQSFSLPGVDARGLLSVVTAEETENLDRLEARVHMLLLAVAVITLAAMLVIAWYSVERGIRPVHDFARSLESVDPDDPAARLDAGPLPSELRPAAASFSALLDRLLEALARERRYARNVAHELRNPLAEIRLLADVGSGSDDADAVRNTIREIGATTEEMQQIVESLLALTRYESGLETPQPEPVDLSAELRRQANALAGAAEHQSLIMELHAPAEAWIHADSALLRRLLANLLGNAVSHAPRGSVVQVTLRPGGELSVANPAPGLRPSDVPRLCERFFRIGNGNHGSHAGLGLSLATAIARVLGLSLTLALGDDGRLVAALDGFEYLSAAGFEPEARTSRT